MERQEILKGLHATRTNGEQAALATVVNVIGSAYRREGTTMLVREDGSYTCMVSGGCLEPEIVYLGQQVMTSGRSVLQRYNLDEERMFGLGIGCAGEMDLYIEPATNNPILARWHQSWRDFELSALITRLDGSGARTFVTPEQVLGTLGAAQESAISQARKCLAQAHPRSGMIDLNGVLHFLNVNLPPPELLLFGAAQDSVAVARLAGLAGFRVRVADMRAALLTPARFPGAELHPVLPEHVGALPIHSHTFVVVMNHHFLLDLTCLRHALRSNAPYIGLLGPRSRLDKLALSARDDQAPFAPQDLARIHNPIGLALGAENTDEVALSVVGELLARTRGFDGGFLDGHSGKIHTPRLQLSPLASD
ncbi:XdhC family protein [Deinococcus oregonensis]|uniref:XdhC family protein n=1 Tax=Deinococcus oregonensis TaxID=1805970 RepID=A0ABV6AYT0_9DEIO